MRARGDSLSRSVLLNLLNGEDLTARSVVNFTSMWRRPTPDRPIRVHSETSPTHLWLNNVRDSFVECLATSIVPQRSYRVSGEKTSNLVLKGSGLLAWKSDLAIEKNVRQGAVHTQ
jgi:hypothetical protein